MFLKPKQDEADARMLAWWKGTGMVVGHWGTGFPADFEGSEAPEGVDLFDYYTNPEKIAEREHKRLSGKSFPLDMLPIAIPDINTLPIALYTGAAPHFSRGNIWYEASGLSPENSQKLIFSPDNSWYQNHIAILNTVKNTSAGEYFVGLPALVPNLDVLVELRGAQNLMLDMVMEPEWVHQKLRELNEVFFEVYPAMLPYATDEKGWSTQGYFMFRGPGKVGLSHCDTAAMISTEMFREFVVPYVQEQCDYLDYSLYHVDGPAALRSVDPLLEIASLRALQFTPGPQVPQGGDPCWYDLYKKIKRAGKSVMAVWIEPEEIAPLLDAVGPEGMYLMVNFTHEKQIGKVENIVRAYR